MLGFVQLLLLQTTLFVGIVWSSCDIEFASFPSINATVNQTVLVECRSNCTPIRLVTKQGTDQEEEIRLYTKLQPVSDYEYDVGAELLLDASLNNAMLICRAFDNGKSYVKKSRIRLQESLQSVKNLSVTPNATHTTFTWKKSLAVLKGVQVNYSVQFFQENNVPYGDQIITETSFTIPSVCPPCRQSNFTVAPVAEQLRGEAISISNNATCTDGYQITMMDNKSFFRNNSENSVQIAFKLTIHDNWCMPFIVIISAVCQHSNTNKNYMFYNLKDDNLITASLPAQDFCSVSLIPQYSNGYTPPHHEPFNISLLDTQSITFETISASHSLCVICDFAPWTKDNTSCVVFIHLLETSYSSSKVAYKNSTGKGRVCFPDLPTDKQYVANITVVDGLYNQTLHSMNVSINFTSSANGLTVIIVTLVTITAVIVAVIGFGVGFILLWSQRRKTGNRSMLKSEPDKMNEKDGQRKDKYTRKRL